MPYNTANKRAKGRPLANARIITEAPWIKRNIPIKSLLENLSPSQPDMKRLGIATAEYKVSIELATVKSKPMSVNLGVRCKDRVVIETVEHRCAKVKSQNAEVLSASLAVNSSATLTSLLETVPLFLSSEISTPSPSGSNPKSSGLLRINFAHGITTTKSKRPRMKAVPRKLVSMAMAYRGKKKPAIYIPDIAPAIALDLFFTNQLLRTVITANQPPMPEPSVMMMKVT